MKLKPLLLGVLISLAVLVGIYFFIEFYSNTAEDPEVSLKSPTIDKIDAKTTNEISKQIDVLHTQFLNLRNTYAESSSEMTNKLVSLKKLIGNIETLKSKYGLSSKTTKSEILQSYNSLKSESINEFISLYEQNLIEQANQFLFWGEIEQTQTQLNAKEIIPETLLKNKRMKTIHDNLAQRILNVTDEFEKLSAQTRQFTKTTYKFINNIAPEKDVQIKTISAWVNQYSEIKTKISPDEIAFLAPRIKSAFAKLELEFFKDVNLSENMDLIDSALQIFPFSHDLFVYIEKTYKQDEKLDTSHKNVFNIVRTLRQNFINLGLVNSQLSSTVTQDKMFSLITFTDFLAFLSIVDSESENPEILKKYLNSWIICISSVFMQNFDDTSESFANQYENLIAKFAFLTILEKIINTGNFDELKPIFLSAQTSTNVILEALSEKIDAITIDFADVIRLYTNAVVYKAEKLFDMLNKLFELALAKETERIGKIESKTSQIVEFAELFTTIETLQSALEYLKSEELHSINSVIKKHYSNELQRKTLNALKNDEKTTTELLKKLDGSCTLAFAGFATDFYNRILLGIKGDKDLSQEMVDNNQIRFYMLYKAYSKMSKLLTSTTQNSIYDALVFLKIHSHISKLSLIDAMLQPNDLNRVFLTNSLASRHKKYSSMIQNNDTINLLFSLISSIRQIPATWNSWTNLQKLKSTLLRLKMINKQNQLGQNSVILVEELLANRFYEILTENFEKQKNETWVKRAKWYLGNFSMYSLKKNNIDEKLKILIK